MIPSLFLILKQDYKDRVDWHCHQNPYFTFILKGTIVEVNRRGSYQCVPGTLLFHNHKNPHYNIKMPGFARGFNIELSCQFFEFYDLTTDNFEGNLKLDNPLIKSLFRRLYIETRLNDNLTAISVYQLLLNAVDLMTKEGYKSRNNKPAWVSKLKAAMHDMPSAELTWNGLASLASIHPVHLSREFPKYFKTTVGDYVRQIKVAQAADLLANEDLSVSTIAYCCGFADQSHFIRTFRLFTGTTPFNYRKLLTRR